MHTTDQPPQPLGVVTNQTGETARPERCRFCLYLDYPAEGVPPPVDANKEVKAYYRNSGYCRRSPPGPGSEKPQRTFWPIVHVDLDWCGGGVV